VKLPTLRRTIASRPSDPPAAEAGRGMATAGRALVVGSSRGQVLVIFSGIFVVLLLMSALVIDLAWLWNNSLRIQRTADASALAGVVNLPTNFSGNNGGPATCKNALTCALTEAARNGYVSGSGGVTVTPTQDGTNPRRLNVKVTAPVQTFFLGLIGMNQVIVSRNAHAEYVLPVPMGSPENYYGVFGAVRDATFTTPASSTGPTTGGVQDTGTGASAKTDTTVPGAANWTVSGSGTLINSLKTEDNNYAGASTNNSAQQWSGFGLSATMPTPGNTVVGTTTTTRTIAITGLQLQLVDAHVAAACAGSNIKVELSWNGGTNWTTITAATGTPTTNQGTTTQDLTTTTTTDYTMGNTNNLTPWVGHAWVLNTSNNDFSDANFRVRTSLTDPCAVRTNLDQLQVIVYYTVTTSTSTPAFTTPAADYPLYGPGVACPSGAANCYMGDHTGNQGQALNARGFWGTMNTQGAENVDGDAFQPYYDTRTGGVALTCPQSAKACHGPIDYYNYGIEMQPSTSGGLVYIYDPVFCETRLSSGTADRHFSGTASVSTFYQLYSDPNNTPYNLSDDALVVDSGNLFTGMAYRDSTMGGTNGSECKQTSGSYGDARDYHNAWYLLNPGNPLTGGPTGTLYRLHTTSTNPNNVTQQQGTDGEQSFAIYASSTQGFGNPSDHPKVYGLGAMQAFTPLEAFGSAQASTFYLAQIDPVHNGKTLEIRLWDPGDTSPLSASLQILIPDDAAVGGFRIAAVTYSGAKGTTNGAANSACNSNSRSTASSAPIQTSTGASLGLFNGCWLTIDTIIPAWYTGDQQGWWKIRYTMNGTGTSSDVTTWMADIRGNPVHLVEP
jgi:Putative Flp pilus-assembly TadE/G-like